MVTRRSSSSELSSPALQWHYNLHLVRLHRSCSPLVEVNISLLADNVGVTTTNTLDLGQGVHDLALSIDVGVEETQDVLQVTNELSCRRNMILGGAYLELLVGFRNDERHGGGSRR